jgi:dihydropteroate synthase
MDGSLKVLAGGRPGSGHEVSEKPVAGVQAVERCEIWGVLNVTPDSFSDGGRYETVGAAVERATAMLEQGADVIDVGGESSRPGGGVYGQGAGRVPDEEEARRAVPVIREIRHKLGARVSVDTVKAGVARQAVAAGADTVNDVSCGGSAELIDVVAETGVSMVLMHNRGRGEVSGRNVAYGDVVADVIEELMRAVERAVSRGVARDKLWIDPGIGFAKTAEQSIELLARTSELAATGYPVLVGPSLKSFVAAAAPARDGRAPAPGERQGGTAAAVTAAVLGGASAVRVHDVFEMRQAALVAESIVRALAGRSSRLSPAGAKV